MNHKTLIAFPADSFYFGGYGNTLPHSFAIGKFVVTESLWKEVMGEAHDGSLARSDNHPLDNVTWLECLYFCNAWSRKEGLKPVYVLPPKSILEDIWELDPYSDIDHEQRAFHDLFTGITQDLCASGYRLPLELEWEYARRSGIRNPKHCFQYAGSNEVDEVAWYEDNCLIDDCLDLHPVGQKKPTQFGLYDMSGNVYEWVWNWYSSEQSEIPTGPSRGTQKVLRGGSYDSAAWYLQYGHDRARCEPTSSDDGYGFRVCRSLSSLESWEGEIAEPYR